MTKYFWIISAVLLIAANESFSQNVIRNVAQQKLAVLCSKYMNIHSVKTLTNKL